MINRIIILILIVSVYYLVFYPEIKKVKYYQPITTYQYCPRCGWETMDIIAPEDSILKFKRKK
jgi:hypothetical protein